MVLKKGEENRAPAGFSSFYGTRRRVYGALLLFVLAAGLPMAIIPKLRDRLITRAWNIKEAMAGNRAPVLVQVGQNQEPLPPEFHRPAPPVPSFPQPSQSSKVYSNDNGGFIPRREPRRKPAGTPSAQIDRAASVREEEAAEETEEPPAAEENQLRYGQGAAERLAYQLLLETNPTVAEITKGNNASYEFKSWDAASRGDGLYWVRLKIQAEGQPESDYIWQVHLESKQVTPLNYNARTVQ